MIDPLEEAWAGTTPAAVPGRRVGAARGRRDARPRRPGLAPGRSEHDRALWDTTGNEVVKALAGRAAQRRRRRQRLALTLVVVVDEKRVREAEAAATIAAAAHPCRLLIVVRSDVERPSSPARRRDRGRRAARPVRGRGHADARPAGPARRVGGDAAARAGRAGGDLVARRRRRSGSRTTRWAWSPTGGSPTRRRPPTRSRRCAQRADDYAPGDTDLAWTRTTPWRTLIAGAFDTADGPVVGGHRASRRRPTRRRRCCAAGCRPGSASRRGWEPTTDARRCVRSLTLRRRRRARADASDDGTATLQPHRPARPHAAAGPAGRSATSWPRSCAASTPTRPYAAALGAATGRDRPRRPAAGAGAHLARPGLAERRRRCTPRDVPRD